MPERKKSRSNGMKSSAVIKCSGQRGDGSAPGPGARWVVHCADKCVALTPGREAEQAPVKTIPTFIYPPV